MMERTDNAMSMGQIKHIHFVGAGGTGMGGIAEVLLHEGYQISGSDSLSNDVTERLSSLGATIYQGHEAEFLGEADVCVQSAAVPVDNPELTAARQKRIPIVQRAEMLAELMRFRYGIAVAGTHGKTTTTSLIASILAKAGTDPTFVIGGLLNAAGSNAQLGAGKYLVAEADESDASFLFLQPMLTVVTNIDADHLENFAGDMRKLRKSFLQFIHHLPFYGLVVMGLDDPEVQQMLPKIRRPVKTFGFHADADYHIQSYQQTGTQTRFTVRLPNQQALELLVNLPGKHNVLNATAAIAVADALGTDSNAMQQALTEFSGIGRRFQIYGDFPIANGAVTLIDDYGHHPKEIEVTVQALRDAYPQQRIVMIFQPHRYTRTATLFDDFARVLSEVDELLLMEVYAASEKPIAGADSRSLCSAIRQRSQLMPIYFQTIDESYHHLQNVLRAGDVLVTQGAGEINYIASQLASTEFKCLSTHDS